MKLLLVILLLNLCLMINLRFLKGARHYHATKFKSEQRFIESWNE